MSESTSAKVSATSALATRASSRAQAIVGFDPISIITLLVPIFANWFSNCGTQRTQTEDPREYLRNRYSEADDSFDSYLVKKLRPETRQLARSQGHHRLSKFQVDQITSATLLESMEAPDEEVTAVMAAD